MTPSGNFTSRCLAGCLELELRPPLLAALEPAFAFTSFDVLVYDFLKHSVAAAKLAMAVCSFFT
jgi:hypothetical protein